ALLSLRPWVPQAVLGRHQPQPIGMGRTALSTPSGDSRLSGQNSRRSEFSKLPFADRSRPISRGGGARLMSSFFGCVAFFRGVARIRRTSWPRLKYAVDPAAVHFRHAACEIDR